MTRRKPVYPIETLTETEVLAILDRFGPGPCGRRNAALVCLLWRTGLRLAEALALNVRDIAPGPPAEIRVRRGKGHKARTVGVRSDAMAMVSAWMDLRTAPKCRGETVLFCSLRSGKPLDQGYVRRTMVAKARLAGIEKRVHPHGLRHTFAMGMDRGGASMEVIKSALGHASIATTDGYLRDYSAADVVAAMTDDDQGDE
jgi:site-specific recombinase XerD